MSFTCSRTQDSPLALFPRFCAAGLSVEVDTLVANSKRTLMANLTAEMERRAVAAHEATGNKGILWAHGVSESIVTPGNSYRSVFGFGLS